MIKLRITSEGCVRGLWTDDVDFAIGMLTEAVHRLRSMSSPA